MLSQWGYDDDDFDSSPLIKSLSTWMTDMKSDTENFGSMTIKDIALPGAHHAGLTELIPYYPLL
jgi:hypothetical protein